MKDMHKFTYTWFMILTLGILSCQESVNIDLNHEPVLQIDAVFFSGDSLPTIEIKRTINAVGSKPYEIPLDEIVVSNAMVVFSWNDKQIPVTEVSKGIYRIDSLGIVQEQDRFEISVEADGLIASAIAIVPSLNTDGLAFALNEPLKFDISGPPNDTLNHYFIEPNIGVIFPFIADFMGIEIDITLDEELEINFDPWEPDPDRIQYVLKENFVGLDTIKIYCQDRGWISSTDLPEIDSINLTITYRLVIPESIYAEFYTSSHNELIPYTVTNVTNGVGLFIGAIQKKGYVSVTTPFRRPNF